MASIRSRALKALDHATKVVTAVLTAELALARTVITMRAQVIDALTPFQLIPDVGKFLESLSDIPIGLERDLWLQVIKTVEKDVARTRAEIKRRRR